MQVNAKITGFSVIKFSVVLIVFVIILWAEYKVSLGVFVIQVGNG